jgi:nucleoside-diphosphate-sugar epimerase
MRVAISGEDDFIRPHLENALGKNVVEITPEICEDDRTLDALLTSCGAVILMNGHPPQSAGGREAREAILAMREAAMPILRAVERHGGLHLVLIGSLRVHPQATPEEPFYSSQATLAPRDVAAEGQLWVEERALEHANEQAPVSILRTSNVQGVPPGADEGHGILHRWASEAAFGWISVPGDGTQVKDVVHIDDIVRVTMHVLENPPPTRETLCIGAGEPVVMNDLAATYEERTGCSAQYGQDDRHEVWGVVDAWEIEQRCGFRPEVNAAEMVEEALSVAGV